MSGYRERGLPSLRKGRLSIPHSRYFVTACCEPRKPVLHRASTANTILNIFRRLHFDGDVSFHCGTVMPDHIHILFTLRDRLSLSQTIAKFKSLTKSVVLEHKVEWQENFFDHRIRVDVRLESFARYIFLNPYAKALIGTDEVWPWWVINRDYHPEFFQFLRDEKYPPSEWLGTNVSLAQLIEQDVTLSLDSHDKD